MSITFWWIFFFSKVMCPADFFYFCPSWFLGFYTWWHYCTNWFRYSGDGRVPLCNDEMSKLGASGQEPGVADVVVKSTGILMAVCCVEGYNDRSFCTVHFSKTSWLCTMCLDICFFSALGVSGQYTIRKPTISEAILLGPEFLQVMWIGTRDSNSRGPMCETTAKS